MRQFIPLITQKKTTSHHHLHPPQHSAQKPRFCAREAQKRGSRRPKAHKNADFVLKKPENGGSEGQKSTKTSILCSNARKWGSRRPKKHKNADFVLGKPENRGPEGQKSTKTHFLCSKSQKMGVPKAKEAQKPRFCGFFVKFRAKIIG